MSDEDTFIGWSVIESPFEFHQQLRAYQRRRDGLVLSIERGTTSWRTDDPYAVNTLPENFYNDSQVIDQIGTTSTEEKAVEMAHEFMEENPR